MEFDVPQYLDDLIRENAISQKGYKTNPLNQGRTAPKIVDKGILINMDLKVLHTNYLTPLVGGW